MESNFGGGDKVGGVGNVGLAAIVSGEDTGRSVGMLEVEDLGLVLKVPEKRSAGQPE
ncbi:hypothetical protein PHLCEN_2v11628 [Hermanssonia centrifuga]|uniref:Uncharacterized protein n=1 Tax=Hermanssonia centrifuga TaxID=98765 RepID=A0A2R6NJD7_9APHY|nr:hypothetical protein PHLCEN_2v11628 [Hermanssonia centrifuga]